jgi:hypothetical protein
MQKATVGVIFKGLFIAYAPWKTGRRPGNGKRTRDDVEMASRLSPVH